MASTFHKGKHNLATACDHQHVFNVMSRAQHWASPFIKKRLSKKQKYANISPQKKHHLKHIQFCFKRNIMKTFQKSNILKTWTFKQQKHLGDFHRVDYSREVAPEFLAANVLARLRLLGYRIHHRISFNYIVYHYVLAAIVELVG